MTTILMAQDQLLKSQDARIQESTKQLNLVTAELRKVKVALRNGDFSKDLAEAVTHECKYILPAKTYEDLLSFENTLNVEDFKRYLMTIGGRSVQRMVSNLVTAVYTLELQTATTWKGIRAPNGQWTKSPLCSTKTPKIIAEVCLAYFPRQTLADVLSVFQRHMMHAMDRQRKIAKASLSPESQNAEQDKDTVTPLSEEWLLDEMLPP